MTNNPKGILTSEFVLTVLGMAAMVYLFKCGLVSKDDFTNFLTYAIPGYAISRGLAKLTVPQNGSGNADSKQNTN